MNRLIVQFGKGRRRTPFHPKLKINVNSGYCRNQWEEMHFTDGVFCGGGCVRQITVEQAVERYFAELRRMGYQVVEG
jgi:phosphosulfolactate synthase (CoM biosynthesis protein A)